MQTIAGIPVVLQRKSIKHLRIAVCPPDGAVEVSAPEGMDAELIRIAVLRRTDWIREKREAMRCQQRQGVRHYVSGESHYFNGERYMLRVQVVRRGEPYGIELRGRRMVMRVYADTPESGREKLLQEWYRARLKEKVAAVLPQWAKRVGVPVPSVRVLRMRTRWGSCSRRLRQIVLNLELAKKDYRGLEYVILHELCHLLEPAHSPRFLELLERFMPSWESVRRRLNEEPLRHEDEFGTDE
ncbi:MAG: SprT family zinc-dependent metalloprotease [Akkermansia sp.]|nr:SprT family zinc-dependent metalloprotease [Akkermansia sp.]